ncbi:MAG: peptidoglycan D,D-transpeptidase FtsI family protein [Pyrinomonadaceae bacterium]
MPKRTTQKKHNQAQTIFSRFLFIVAFFVIWIGIIGVRLVHLQVNQSDWLRTRALSQRRDETKSKTLRGSILDRADRALAVSVNVNSLYADPAEIEDVKLTAQRLAPVLKVKPQEIAKSLQEAKDKNKRFVWLARKVDAEVEKKLNETLKDTELKKYDEPRFKGLHWRAEQKRSYPYGTLAAQIVGFSNLDDVGQAGIEQSQETSLRGAIIKSWQDRDRLGRVYDQSETEEREPPKDVVLTISHSIQYKVEEALKKGVQAANAKSGMAVVLDPKTGEILALANYPTFDPNKYTESPAENYTNKAIQNIYSPGSVFKIVTYGSALQEKLITPDGMLDCGNGTLNVAGHIFRDPHCGSQISYTDALAISSNIGAIKTGMRVGKEKFYNYARNFGFGDVTGIELPAEARGQLRPPQQWFGDSLASMSIGYEIGVTALQTASAFAIIANNGVRIRPHIIKEIRQADGKVLPATEIEKSRVVSEETARNLRRMLQKVVLKGTGKRAAINGYTSAGKTGTAWKYDPKLKKVSSDKYVASFVGMAPAENPAVVIAVVMDEPRSAARNGGDVSAPVFKEIAEQILPADLNIAPDGGIVSPDAFENVPGELEAENIPAANGIQNFDKTDAQSAVNSKPSTAKESKKELSKTSKEVLDKPKTATAIKTPKSEEKNKTSTTGTRDKT